MSSPERVVVIEFFGDYVCPYCYLTVPVLYQAQQRLGDAVEVVWRGLEQRPYPIPLADPTTSEYTLNWRERIESLASERGLAPLLPSALPRSRRAMEAAAFARQAGLFDSMHKAIYSAFFEQGRDISQVDELVRIGGDAGLVRADLRRALDQGAYVVQVMADRREAERYGVAGLPVMVLRRADQAPEQAQALWGAQPLEGVLKGVEIVSAGD